MFIEGHKLDAHPPSNPEAHSALQTQLSLKILNAKLRIMQGHGDRETIKAAALACQQYPEELENMDEDVKLWMLAAIRELLTNQNSFAISSVEGEEDKNST